MIPELSSFVVFVVAGLVLLLTPGPAVLYIVTRSIEQGRAAGIVSALGVGLGTCVHVVGVTFGLSALLLTSAFAFTVVKYLGAAYLVYLGVRKILSKDEALVVDGELQERALWSIFRQGVVVNILNPKTALFFFAFLPQFVDPSRGSVAGQFLFLGLFFTIMGITTDSVYAVLASLVREVLRTSRVFGYVRRYVAGAIFVLLGAGTAVSGNK